MFNHTSGQRVQVKLLSTLTLKGLEKEINAFGSKHEISNVSISNSPSAAAGYVAAITYLN